MSPKWPVVELIWHDAHGGDTGWDRLAGHHSRPAEVRSVGMMAKRSARGVTLVMSIDKSTDHFGGYLFVPESNIVTITELRS